METITMEAKLKDKYNISTLYPAAWPEEKDQESDDEDDEPQTSTASTGDLAPAGLSVQRNASRRKSRYSVLESTGSFSRKLPGVEKSRDGVETMVQKDESDPLGTFPSVVQVLRQKGLPVEEDIRLSE